MNPNKEYMGPGWFWKPLSISIISFTVGLTLMVLREHVMLREFITKAEAQEMIENAPYPYIPDKKAISERFDSIDKRLDKIDYSIEYIKQNLWKRSRIDE